jgi:hypothetical protein
MSDQIIGDRQSEDKSKQTTNIDYGATVVWRLNKLRIRVATVVSLPSGLLRASERKDRLCLSGTLDVLTGRSLGTECWRGGSGQASRTSGSSTLWRRTHRA